MKRIRIEPLGSSGVGTSQAVDLTESGAETVVIEGPSYIERMAEQRKAWREADRAKFFNPDRDPEAEQIWVVYAWLKSRNGAPFWHCLGEKAKKTRRRKPMTMNRLFANLRQSLGLAKETPVLLISRQDDQNRRSRGESMGPPKHHDTLRPHKPPAKALKLQVLPPTPKRKVRNSKPPQVQLKKKTRSDGTVRFTFKTRYVAWGRVLGKTWYFLGACADGTRKGATAEIKGRYPMHSELKVLEVKSLKYSVRARIMDGRIRAGVTKMEPPK